MENCINLKNDSNKNLCIKCGKEIDDSWSYCPYCTTEVITSKCSCGSQLHVTWLFCPYCKREINPVQSEKSKQDGNEWLRKVLENE